MKYWIYKDSRILGPFDKNAVSGLPGLDASTLVCAGESAAAGEGDWRPAGDVADLATLPLDRGASWPVEEMSSTYGLLDKLQIDAAGLIGDDEFPGAAEDLFQDADMKRAFGDLIVPRPNVDETELRRAKDRAIELTAQLEILHKRMTEMEAGQTDLIHRLAEKEIQLKRNSAQASVPPAENSAPKPEAKSFSKPIPTVVPNPVSAASAPPEAVRPVAAEPPAAPSEWAAIAGGGAFPKFPSLDLPAPVPMPPQTQTPVAFAPIPPLAPAAEPAAPMDSGGPPLSAAPSEPPATDQPIPIAPPKKAQFEKKTFKIVPTLKTFKIVGAENMQVPTAPPAPEPAAAPPVNAFEWGAAASPIQEPMPAAPPALTPAPEPAPIAPPSTPTPPPAIVPPVTLSFGAAPQFAPTVSPLPPFPEARPFGGGASENMANASLRSEVTGSSDDMAGAPSTQDALARLAKPAPGPTTEPPRAPRSNKVFLIGAAALVIVMAAVGSLFLRHPKELKQMTELDDGRARVGAEPTDDPAHMPMVKPKMAEPPAAEPPVAEASQAASQAKLDAAVSAVKDFPLDGERGTVAQWLQFSYSASPDAGKESWSASETADKTYLVEYRFTPSGRGDAVHNLFEVDMERGFVIGKNVDAKSVLAGGAPVVLEKTKPKAKPRKRTSRRVKKVVKRAAPVFNSKDVPLLPLRSEEELRPPAEDDGSFNADTVNSGL